MEYFMNPDFFITQISFVGFAEQKRKCTNKNRPNYGFSLAVSGLKEFSFSDGHVFDINESDVLFLPKNSSYSVSPKVAGDCYTINFELETDVDLPPFVIKAKNFSDLLKHFKNAKKLWERKETGYATKCMAEIYNIIYILQQEYIKSYQPQSKHAIIAPAVKHIHKSYTTEAISIETLSEMCNITPEYFRKLFKNFYGVSPIKYINNLKITRARELIESGLHTITEAAFLAGYTDISHFSREFKKATGYCPTDYQK